MYSYSLIEWLFFFYFYCFFGWCFESTYVSLTQRHLVNRGFLRGPFLPLYGTGAIMMLVVSAPFQGNVPMIYLAGCVGATALEYVTGVAMEALFKVRYWDYSKQKFQFQGHICLSSTLAWGLLTIFMTQWLHEKVESVALFISKPWMEGIVLVITVILAVDFTLSFKAAMDLRDILVKMEQAREDLQRISKRLDVIIAVAEQQKSELRENVGEYREHVRESINGHTENLRLGIAELKENIEDRLERLKVASTKRPTKYLDGMHDEIAELRYKYRMNLDRREHLSRIRDFYQKNLMKAFPGMTSERFKEALEELREKLNNK